MLCESFSQTERKGERERVREEGRKREAGQKGKERVADGYTFQAI